MPISFFIKGKNNFVKQEILKNFSTIIIYQDNKTWFDYDIPCSFAIFTNISDLDGKAVLIYEKFGEVGSVVLKAIVNEQDLLTDELIPNTYFYRQKVPVAGQKLSKFLSPERVRYKRSYTENNITAGNILEHTTIPPEANVEDYSLAVCRVGNSSVGRAGLVDTKKDILNDTFYVFGFDKKYQTDSALKERVVHYINRNQDYFKNITIRVGSKSIRQEHILNFRVTAPKGT